MNWLNKLKGKAGLPGPDEDKAQQEPRRPAGSTVVRAGARPAPTIAKTGPRFKPNEEVTADLQIKSVLGSGAMGEVYLARQRMWDVDIALKIPNDEILSDSENRHRIVREAEAWTDLGLHPNIAYCYYAQPLGELLLLVIEYVDGGNLRDWIASGRCADLKTGLDLAIQFCHGLEHAHKKGLIHRDIKPENVLLMKDGTLKITDFGIVRKALASPERLQSSGATRGVAAGMTTVGIGTADYMAPEQWGDQSELDSSADIFAFGVCVYEMLCGGRPYEITAGPRQEAPDPGHMRGAKGLPERLCRLMMRCVNWDRERRPADAKEVRAELCAVYENVIGTPSLYAELPELTTQADDWNNRALSYLALGQMEDADKAWQMALEADPSHADSTYNYGLHRWRGGRATDLEVLANLRGIAPIDTLSTWLPGYMRAQVHLERGDTEEAERELARLQENRAAMAEVVEARRVAAALPNPSRLVRTIGTHSGGVRSVCLSPDAQFALSGGWNRTPQLWDLNKGRCVRFFEGHANYIRSVSMSADGMFALSGGEDNSMRFWDVKNGRCLQTYEALSRGFTSVYLSADARLALSGGGYRDTALKLWELATGCCLRSFEDLAFSTGALFLSADGAFALSGSAGDTIKLWDVETGHRLRTFVGHSSSVLSVCLSHDARFALSGSADKTLKLWDVESGRCLRTFEGHKGKVNSVSLSGDGRQALSGSDDKTLRLWEVESGRCLRTFEGHTDKVESVCLSADGRVALSGGNDNTIRLWSVGIFNRRSSFRLSRIQESAKSIAGAVGYASAMAEARAASSAGNLVRALRCLRRARQEPQYRRAQPATQEWTKLYTSLRKRTLAGCWTHLRNTLLMVDVSAGTVPDDSRKCSLSADGRFLLSRGTGVHARLWSVQSGRRLGSLLGNSGFVTSVYLSTDARFAIVGSSGNELKLWEAKSGHCLRTFEGHSSNVEAVFLSVDARFVLSGSKDRTVKLWEAKTGRCLRTFAGHSGAVESACLSADTKLALSGSRDKTMRLWEVATGRCLHIFKGHSDLVSSICLSSDARFALSGSKDGTLKLWEAETGRCLRTLAGHSGAVESVCLSMDARFALSGSDDKTMKLWELEGGRCLSTLEHEDAVTSVGLSADGQYAISTWGRNAITVWFLDWDLEENEPADWDEGARPYLDIFLRAHQPYAASLPKGHQRIDEDVTLALTRRGRPVWSEENFQKFLYTLGCAGYGWLRPEGVRNELKRMAAAWKDSE